MLAVLPSVSKKAVMKYWSVMASWILWDRSNKQRGIEPSKFISHILSRTILHWN